jgi:hypothetical protein
VSDSNANSVGDRQQAEAQAAEAGMGLEEFFAAVLDHQPSDEPTDEQWALWRRLLLAADGNEAAAGRQLGVLQDAGDPLALSIGELWMRHQAGRAARLRSALDTKSRVAPASSLPVPWARRLSIAAATIGGLTGRREIDNAPLAAVLRRLYPDEWATLQRYGELAAQLCEAQTAGLTGDRARALELLRALCAVRPELEAMMEYRHRCLEYNRGQPDGARITKIVDPYWQGEGGGETLGDVARLAAQVEGIDTGGMSDIEAIRRVIEASEE